MRVGRGGRSLRSFTLFVCVGTVALGCGGGSASSSSGQTTGDAGADSAGPPSVAWFSEIAPGLSGVAVTHQPNLAIGMSGGIGVAVGDIDGDGKPDLVAPSGLGPTYVFENEGAWRFADVSAKSGVDGHAVANGASLCDIDDDGDLDLFLSTDQPRSQGTLFFFRNAGDGTFTDETTAAGFADTSCITSVVCTDLDADGLLDVYVAAYGFVGSSGFPGRQDAFFRNRGDGTFVDLATRLGFDADGLTWTVAASDYDRDGDLDLYVGNDTFAEDDGKRPLPPLMNIPGTSAPGPGDALYRNDGPGTDGYPVFTNVASTAGAPLSFPRGTMGIVAEDLTGDGIPDYFLSNYGRKALLAGSANGTFSDVTTASGLEATKDPLGSLLVSWGSALEDVDLDGHRDLVLLDGDLHGVQQVQSEWRGTPSGFQVVKPDLPPMVARGLVAADLDGDGDLDLALTNWRGATRLFENVASHPASAGAGWLAVVAKATTSAAEGRGAVVTVGGVAKTIGVGGLLDSSRPAEARFGLGAQTSTDVDVAWPSGFRSHVSGAHANQVLVVKEPQLVTVSARVVPADGISTVLVLVTPAKPDGSPLGAGATVTIDATSGVWRAPVVDRGDGSYARILVAPTSPALVAMTVTVGGVAMSAHPRVEFR